MFLFRGGSTPAAASSSQAAVEPDEPEQLSTTTAQLVARAGGLPSLVQSLALDPGSADEATCRALAELAEADTRRRLSLCEAGGARALVAVLGAKLEAAPVARLGCRALAELAADATCEVELREAHGAAATLARTMARHLLDVEVQREACRALAALAGRGGGGGDVRWVDAEPDGAGEAAAAPVGTTASVVRAVCAAARAHGAAEAGLAEHACAVLVGVSAGDDAALKRSICAEGGAAAAVGLMSAHADVAAVLQLGCHALANLAQGDSECEAAVVGAGGALAVTRAMLSNAAAEPEVQWQGCRALFNLSSESTSESRRAVREAGGLTALMFAMTTHAEHAALQREGGRVMLRHAADGLEGVRALLEAGAGATPDGATPNGATRWVVPPTRAGCAAVGAAALLEACELLLQLADGGVDGAHAAEGRTLLQHAARLDQTRLARRLLLRGADPGCADASRGHACAAHLAAEAGHVGMARLLLQHGAPLEAARLGAREGRNNIGKLPRSII